MIVHVIPVPRGYTPEDAWQEIATFGRLRCSWWRRRRCKWAVIQDA